MSIAKYNTVFTEKLQFARDYCSTEEKVIRHYVEGLPNDYLATVRLQTTIGTAMDEARRVEDDLSIRDRATVKFGDKRKWEGQSGFSRKKNFQFKKGDSRDKPEYCKKCHSSHRGPCNSSTLSCKRCGKIGHRFEDCRSTKPMCYNCRQMGHISTQCPNSKIQPGVGGKKDDKPKVSARLFNMTVDEARHSDEVIFGTFLINSIPASVLFDPGASRSFAIEVVVPIGEPVTISEKYDACVISIAENTFPVTLIPLCHTPKSDDENI
ncbi:hypothetical protein LXL04_024498 [Taraxacum kok-saghyz]